MARASVTEEANERVVAHVRALVGELGGQGAAAKAIGVSQGTVSALLHGRQRAGLQLVRGLARRLRIPVGELTGGTMATRRSASEGPRGSETGERLALLLRALDEAEARLEEVDLRTTSLAIGQGNIGAALERTEALTDKLESLEARAVVLEAAMAKRAKVTISRAVGLGGPALAWVKGDITTGRWAEVLTDWLNGKDRWVAEDVGLEAWPEPPAWMGEDDDIPW